MAWLRPALHSKWGTKVPASSIANTVAFLGNRLYGMSELFVQQMLRC